MVSLVLE